MKVKLDKDAFKPVRAHDLDAGYDLFARTGAVIAPRSAWAFDTGVHFQIPAGYVGFIKSKSGLNVNCGVLSEGVIDSGYTGSVVVKLYNHSACNVVIEKGQKISQIVFLPIFTPCLEIVDNLEATARGNNGFGSTGK